MKKILKIKWENILTTLLALFFIDCMLTHTMMNGIRVETILFETMIYSIMLGIICMVVYGFRKEFLKA